jgi:hypothetical protein
MTLSLYDADSWNSFAQTPSHGNDVTAVTRFASNETAA